jgi:iron complex transport system ATP-binding protein
MFLKSHDNAGVMTAEFVANPSLTAPLVEARDVSFSYSNIPVLTSASLALPRGSIAAMIGANGSGKSTLLRLLAGLLKPRSGVVAFNGAPLSSLDPRERAKHVAYVPQSSSTIFPFTALEVVLTGRNPYSGRFGFESKEDEDIALESLAALDAAHLAARPITELSGGEQQLVTVARALAQEPEVMFLDEPASALDLKHRAQLTRSLLRLRDERNITVLTVTHDLMLLNQTFDMLFAMKYGRVVASGTPEAVLDDALLGDIYDTPVRTMRNDGRIFVWSEL